MLIGYVDNFVDLQLTGWAADPDDFGVTADIHVFAEATEIAAGKADRFRQDLQASGIGAGAHAYDIAIPPQFRMARLRVLARAGDAEIELAFPDREDRIVERVLDVAGNRFEAALQQMRRDQKLLARMVEEDRARAMADAATVAAVQDRLAALEKRMDEADLFLMRIDASLRKLVEERGKPPRRGWFGWRR